MLWLRGITDQPAGFTDTNRDAFSGSGLLSSYGLTDLEMECPGVLILCLQILLLNQSIEMQWQREREREVFTEEWHCKGGKKKHEERVKFIKISVTEHD